MKKNEINNEGVALYLPIKMDAVTEMRFEQNYGTHAMIEIKGILHTEEEVENAYEMDMKDKILLKKKDKILFSGVSGKTVVQKKGNVFFVHITGYSRSILLDMEKKKKSFQKNTTYQSILEEKVGSGGILKMQSSLEDKEKKQLYVQYRETDWEFMKRLASQIHAQICPDITVEKTCVMVGVPKGKKYRSLHL